MNNNVEIFIENNWPTGRVDFWVYEYRGNTRLSLSFDKSGRLVETIISDDQINPESKPFLRMPARLAGVFIESVAEYAKNKGITVKEISNAAGKLEATEKHLEFLQGNFTKILDKLIDKF